MGRRLTLLLIALAVLVGGSIIFLRVGTVPAPGSSSAPPKKRSGPTPAAAKEDPAGYDEVKVRITIPPLSDFPDAWAQGSGCSHTKLSRTLGAALSQGGGVAVFAVEPGKPADRAGLKPGDRLGPPEACPNTLVDTFSPRREPRTLTWTIRRPKTAALREAAAKEAAQVKFPKLAPADGATPKKAPAEKRG